MSALSTRASSPPSLEEFHDPFFYDEITEGGHGAGADNKQASQMWGDTYTYLMMKLMDLRGFLARERGDDPHRSTAYRGMAGKLFPLYLPTQIARVSPFDEVLARHLHPHAHFRKPRAHPVPDAVAKRLFARCALRVREPAAAAGKSG